MGLCHGPFHNQTGGATPLSVGNDKDMTEHERPRCQHSLPVPAIQTGSPTPLLPEPSASHMGFFGVDIDE